MSDRSSKPSFAVSRNLKYAKYHFIEAITDKQTESSNNTPNSVSTSAWLCVTSNMKSTSHKTWQTSLLFLELLRMQNLKRKNGGTSHIMSPPPEKVEGTRPPCPPPNCAQGHSNNFHALYNLPCIKRMLKRLLKIKTGTVVSIGDSLSKNSSLPAARFMGSL